jgi:thioredoxin 1
MKKIKMFGAPWCAPCSQVKETLKLLNAEYEYINVDDDPMLARDNGIRSIPTLIAYDNDVEVKRITGGQPKEKIADFLFV